MYLYEGPICVFKKKTTLRLVQPDSFHAKYSNGIYSLILCQKILNDYPIVQYLIGSSSWPEQGAWRGVVCSCLVLKCRSGSILPQPQCIIEKSRFHHGSRFNTFCPTINCSQKYYCQLCHLKLMKQEEKNHSQTRKKKKAQLAKNALQ